MLTQVITLNEIIPTWRIAQKSHISEQAWGLWCESHLRLTQMREVVGGWIGLPLQQTPGLQGLQSRRLGGSTASNNHASSQQAVLV